MPNGDIQGQEQSLLVMQQELILMWQSMLKIEMAFRFAPFF
jgi:hypothetical protein